MTSEEDARRQAPVVAAIVEAGLHQRIFDADWRVIPGYTRRHPAAARAGPTG